MKLFNLILVFIVLIGVSACNDNQGKSQAATGEKASMPENHPDVSGQSAQQNQPGQESISGTVTETMNTAGYTYVKVDTGSEEVWVAAPEFEVKVGDPVIVGESMPMPNYHSNTLNRDFELVYFAGNVAVAGDEMSLHEHSGTSPHASSETPGETHSKPAKVDSDVDFSTLKPLEGGKSLAEVFAQKDELEGKEVAIRAKVVKFTPNIMKTNWIHIQDGSEGNPDLTVTSSTSAGVGDTVVVRGVLEKDKDFGYGYKYDLIIQNAEVTVEE
jgi:hypothetical protein